MHKKYSKREKVDAFIRSWLLALFFGVALAIVSGLILNFINNLILGSEDIRNITIYFLIFLLLIFLFWIALQSYAKDQFIKYFRLALSFGFIFSLGCAILLIGISLSFNPNNSQGCNMEDQLTTAQNATYPIATDKGTGTAFAVRPDGTLLTAYHVVEGAQRVYVNYVNEEIPLSIVDTSPEYDLAVLKMDRPTKTYLKLISNYKVSDKLYAMGYPGNTFTAGQATLSSGILSRILENSDLKLNNANTPDGLEIIQTDTAVNPGNSGGPIFNKCGVVGVVGSKSDRNQLEEYGIASEEGISFAISSKSAASRFALPIDSN